MTIIFAQTIVHELNNSSFVFHSTIMWMRNVRYGALIPLPSDFISHHRHHLFTIFFFFSLLDWCVRLILLCPLSVIFFCCSYCWYFTFSLPVMLDAWCLMPWCPDALFLFLSIHVPSSWFFRQFLLSVRLIVICMLNVECWVVNVCHPIYFVCIHTEKGQCIQNNDKCKGDEKHLNGTHFVIE